MAATQTNPWQDLYNKAEEMWSGPLQDMMSTDAFASMMQVSREAFLAQQEMLRDGAEKYWETLRIPTKNDFNSVARLVVNLEGRIEQLEETLEDKLDKVLAALAALQRQDAQAEVTVPASTGASKGSEARKK